jgi:hypothetical protein
MRDFRGRSKYFYLRDGGTGGWRKIHNAEPRDLFSALSAITQIKSKMMGLFGHVTRIRDTRNA